MREFMNSKAVVIGSRGGKLTPELVFLLSKEHVKGGK